MTPNGAPGDDAEVWEFVARETLYWALSTAAEDVRVSTEQVAETVYWSGDVSAEEVEAMREVVFELAYATEAYLARLCAMTTPRDLDAYTDGERDHPAPLPNVSDAEGDGDDDGGEAR